MIIGTGIDLVEIESIKKIVAKNPRFVARYFGEDEIAMLTQKNNETAKIQSIAANFAAKEAFSKSIGTGVRNFSLKDVQILRDDLGAPYLKLNESLNEHINKKFSVSLSHTNNYATAIVIAYIE